MTLPLLPGRPLCGFWGWFQRDFGDPATESPMVTVTPSSVGSALLPFRCPRCRVPAQALACPVTREHYRDPRPGRDNHFCPSCGCRVRIDLAGTPLRGGLPAGAEVGPSRVERAGAVTWQDLPEGVVSTVLGVIFGRRETGRSGYEMLASRRDFS